MNQNFRLALVTLSYAACQELPLVVVAFINAEPAQETGELRAIGSSAFSRKRRGPFGSIMLTAPTQLYDLINMATNPLKVEQILLFEHIRL